MKNLASTSGFSLVEMIVALGLFSITLVAAFSALSQGMFLSTNTRLESDAAVYLNKEMEHLRSMSWSSILNLPEEGGFTSSPPDTRLNGIFTKTLRKPDQFILKLEVRWLDSQNHQQEATAISFLSQNGLGAL